MQLAAAEGTHFGRNKGGATHGLCGIAVIADAEKRTIAAVIVVPERPTALIGIAAQIAERCIDRCLPALPGFGTGGNKRAIGAEDIAMSIIKPLLVAR
jgi:hypothetical protein